MNFCLLSLSLSQLNQSVESVVLLYSGKREKMSDSGVRVSLIHLSFSLSRSLVYLCFAIFEQIYCHCVLFAVTQRAFVYVCVRIRENSINLYYSLLLIECDVCEMILPLNLSSRMHFSIFLCYQT